MWKRYDEEEPKNEDDIIAIRNHFPKYYYIGPWKDYSLIDTNDIPDYWMYLPPFPEEDS